MEEKEEKEEEEEEEEEEKEERRRLSGAAPALLAENISLLFARGVKRKKRKKPIWAPYGIWEEGVEVML